MPDLDAPEPDRAWVMLPNQSGVLSLYNSGRVVLKNIELVLENGLVKIEAEVVGLYP